MAAWYCLIGDKEYGPFSSERIQNLVEQGKLTREHFVRPSTDTEWTAASEIPGLFPAETAASPLPPKVVPTKAEPPEAPPLKAKPPIASATKKPPVVQPRAPTEEKPAIPSAVPVAAPAATPVATPAGLPVATPVAPNAPEPPVAGASETIRRGRRKSKQQPYLIAGGLAAVLIVLAVAAVAMLGRSPGTRSGEGKVASSADHPAIANTLVSEDVEANPNVEAAADAETDPEVQEPARQAAGANTAPALPPVSRWLDASRKIGILSMESTKVRFHVVNAWLDSSQPGPPTLTVEVALTNASSSESLDYRPWTTEGQATGDTAVWLADDKGRRLTAASASRREDAVAAARRLKPRQSVTERLVFTAPAPEYRFLRLVLPYAAVGRTGCMGFQIPRVMVKDRPPDSEEAVAEVQGQGPAPAKTPTGTTHAKPGESGKSPSSGEPFTIDRLRESINRSLSDGPATNPELESNASPAAIPEEPDLLDGPKLKVERNDRAEKGARKE